MTLHCLYRISDNSYKKAKVERATKKRCLLNFLVEFPLEEIHVFKDKCVVETEEFLQAYSSTTGLDVHAIEEGSSAQSFRYVIDYALECYSDNDYVYLIEDDYWHLSYSRRCLLEGLERADYVTLYDCPDKYIPASRGGNPLIDDTGSDETRVILTQSRHWRLTNSTTCTFATSVGTLREDYEIWKQFCFATTEQTHPHDFPCFLELRKKGRTLISPIPTLSTHCDEKFWLAPLLNWDDEI